MESSMGSYFCIYLLFPFPYISSVVSVYFVFSFVFFVGVEADHAVELGEFDHAVQALFCGAVLGEVSKEVVEGFGDGVDGAAGPEYEGEAHLLKFFGRDEGCLAAFDHVGYEVGAAAGEFFGEFFEFFSVPMPSAKQISAPASM